MFVTVMRKTTNWINLVALLASSANAFHDCVEAAASKRARFATADACSGGLCLGMHDGPQRDRAGRRKDAGARSRGDPRARDVRPRVIAQGLHHQDPGRSVRVRGAVEDVVLDSAAEAIVKEDARCLGVRLCSYRGSSCTGATRRRSASDGLPRRNRPRRRTCSRWKLPRRARPPARNVNRNRPTRRPDC